MAEKVKSRICLAVILSLPVITGMAQAATITVGPGVGYDFDNIQSGIDAALDGDTVLVAPGEYVITEPITFRGKAITVKSETGPDETTIRIGTPTDPKRGTVVFFENNETAASVLDGFTITGGRGSWSPVTNNWGGGGIGFLASSGTVRNCAVVENTSKNGGGIMVYSGSNATLTNCVIQGNSATGVTYGVDGYGGGLFCGMSSLLTMTNCTITGNSAVRGGGGVHCWQSLSFIMANCSIISNTVQYAGGGMTCDSSSAILTNCVIARNTGAMWGGGLCIAFADSSMTISNCTIWGNSATEGGGVGCFNGGSAKVTNSILWGNMGNKGSEIFLEQNPTRFSISYSDVANGRGGISVEGGSTLDWGEGNINIDPYFAEPGYWADVNDLNVVVEPNDPNAVWIDGDYHLKSEVGRWDPVSESWVVDDVTSPCIDAGDPNMPVGDEPEHNGGRINMGAYGGTAQASISPVAEQIVYVQWLGHSSVKVWTDDCVVYVDPQSLSISPHDATFVCVTHTHGDHYSRSDITRISNDQTQFIGPPDVVSQHGSGLSIAPWQKMEFDFVNIEAVPSYNTNKSNHPKSRNWLGYIIELGGKRVYVAGDTDLIEEMKMLGDINVAFLPAGGTYTMNATEAAEATEYIKPDLAIPYHWGRNVGTLRDAETFAELACCAVEILSSGQTISSDNWPVYSPLLAHWPLDEAEGDIANDIAGENHGTLSGEPAWQPAGGKIGGALLFDGIDDYITTDFVLDPAKGSFSVFAWIKGRAAGEVIVSQADGSGSGETWLGVDPLGGKLMTGLVPPAAGRFVQQPLVSESVINNDQWHHVGFAWDGAYRILYLDGEEVAKDTNSQNPLKSADGGLYIGAGKNLETGTFFSGLIDDIRIYNMALNNDEITSLTQ